MPSITKHPVTAKVLEQQPGAYAWYALGLLTLVYVLNFLDRTLIYILFTPIKRKWRSAICSWRCWVQRHSSFFTRPWEFLWSPLRSHRPQEHDRGRLAIWSVFSGLTGFANSFRALSSAA